MNQVNYQRELDKILSGIEAERKKAREAGKAYQPLRLLLHSCCAPCSSYVLEYLASYFALTVFYYNPNISASEEYRKRVAEQKRLIAAYNEEGRGNFQGVENPIRILEGDYRPEDFYRAAEGYEDCPEGGERCFRCYELRLKETARVAEEMGADYFGTTLTISPLKNAAKLNEIGLRLASEAAGGPRTGRESEGKAEGKVEGKAGEKAEEKAEEKAGEGLREKALLWLPSDFKKKGGYQRSVELSAQYGLYRQDFCGCSFSRAEREERIRRNASL